MGKPVASMSLRIAAEAESQIKRSTAFDLKFGATTHFREERASQKLRSWMLPPFMIDNRLPADFHLMDHLVGQAFNALLHSGRDALPAFRNKHTGVAEEEGELSGWHEAIFHQQISAAVDPRHLDVQDGVESPRVIRAVLRYHLLHFAGDTAGQRTVRRRVADHFVRRSQLDRFLKRFGQLHTDRGAEGVVAHDGNIDRAQVAVIERVIAKLIGSTAREQAKPAWQAARSEEHGKNDPSC